MITVRPVSPDEWDRWREVRLRALAEAPDAFGDTLAESGGRPEADWKSWVADRPDACRLLALDGDRPVGQAVVMLDPASTARANVYAMWVAPEVRGQGAARALMAAALGWARDQAALDVSLKVSDRAAAARSLYVACGFEATGEVTPLRPGSAITSERLAIRLPPLVMGVVNVTPDSFSDGGEYLDATAAIAHGQQLVADGADILDIGGEATNPRATAVTAEDELRRVLPVIEGLGAYRLSIDTTKAAVARAAVAAGASIVNDVSGGLFDPAMAETVRALGVRYIAGHLRGRTLDEVFSAEGTVSWPTVASELADRVRELPTAWVDPGLGFGKGGDPAGNVALLRHGGDMAATVGRPIVVGASRKRFVRRLAALTDGATRDAVDAASTLVTLAAIRAGAHVVRVHNVALLHTALTAYNKK